MRRILFRPLFLTLVLFFGLAPALMPTAAQAQDVPTATEQRATMRAAGFPADSDLEPGWNANLAYTTEADADLSFTIHEVTYASSYGDRISIVAGMYDRASETDALDVFSFVLDEHVRFLQESDAAPSSRQLRDLPDPDGCDAVQRATGEEPLMLFYVGSILCQDSANDRVLLVTVSGNYGGDNFQLAAEAVLEIVLETTPR